MREEIKKLQNLWSYKEFYMKTQQWDRLDRCNEQIERHKKKYNL